MKRLSIVVAVVLSVSALAGAFFWPADEAAALPSQERTCFFFSDAAHTNLVGGVDVTCSGVYRWGTLTQYQQCFDLGPC